MRNLTFEMSKSGVLLIACYHPYSSYMILLSAVDNNQECASNGENNKSVQFLSFNFSKHSHL